MTIFFLLQQDAKPGLAAPCAMLSTCLKVPWELRPTARAQQGHITGSHQLWDEIVAALCHPSPGLRRRCPEPISAVAAPQQWRVPWAPSSSLLLHCGSGEGHGDTPGEAYALPCSQHSVSASPGSVSHCDLLPMAHYRAWVVAHGSGRWAGRTFLQVSKAGGCLQGVREDCSGPLASWLPSTRGRKGTGWAPGGPRGLPACQAHTGS